MSTDQLFSNGGQANSFDQLRDQLKEKDEEVLYLYDNSTSRECNDVMRGLEENRQDDWHSIISRCFNCSESSR